MKVIDLIDAAEASNLRFFSLEFFPPRTDAGVTNLLKRVESMSQSGPLFVNVTWSQRTKMLTPDICSAILKYAGVEVIMHITCAEMTVDEVRTALNFAKKSGIRNIFALRGDLPPNQKDQPLQQQQLAFPYASDLVKFIRLEFGDSFGIGVAGYPEGWNGCGQNDPAYLKDIEYLKLKVANGADFIITQLFYDPQIYVKYVSDCRAAGITCPIIPGIMPISNFKPFKRTVDYLKVHVPESLSKRLEAVKSDDSAVKLIGAEYVTRLCERVIEQGAPGIHFNTLNLEQSVHMILDSLMKQGFVRGWFLEDYAVLTRSSSPGNQEMSSTNSSNVRPFSSSNHRQLPWRHSVYHPTRVNELIRPIYWANRPRSYVDRTENWDEFPNGRWGNKNSPAFGEFNEFHFYRRSYGTEDERRSMWGDRPQHFSDIFDVFVKYLEGKVSVLPWTESGIALETGEIKDSLIRLNAKGFMTINSQPRVNGLPSNDKNFGWGPSGGFVYQKAYLEFFTHRRAFAALQSIIESNPQKYGSLQYHAVNHDGSIRWETPGLISKTCAVTWGVFPGREIQQPTIADSEAAMVWKDEAFALWRQTWASLYSDGTISQEIIYKIHDEYLLVNVIDNNYVNGNIFQVFDDSLLQECLILLDDELRKWEEDHTIQ